MVAPRGLGVYMRDPRVRGTPAEAAAWYAAHYDFVAVNADLPGDVPKVYGAAIGLDKWVYAGVGLWRPNTWRDGLARCLDVATAIGARGIIADPENGWPDTVGDTDARELGHALSVAADSGWDVGVSSYPLMPKLAAIAHELGGCAWGQPQYYYKNRSLGSYAAWNARWREMGFKTLLPAISGWQSHETSTPGRHQALLDTLGYNRGALVWITPGGPRGWVAEQLAAYRPSMLPRPIDRAIMRVEGVMNMDIKAIAAIAGGTVGATLLGAMVLK